MQRAELKFAAGITGDMPMLIKTNGYLEEYYQKCKSGEIIIGYELMCQLEKLMADMHKENYLYDTTDADIRIDFIENVVRMSKSPFYGKPMKLMLFQKAFISALYGFKMADSSLDRFKKSLFLISRKNGKTELTAALVFSELVIGNPGEDIVCSGGNDKLASLVYEAVDTMRQLVDPQSKDIWKNQFGIKNLITKSKIFKLSETTRGHEGRNIDFASCDESHELLEGNSITKAIEQSQSIKLNPKYIELTTEGFVTGGHLDKQLEYARGILAGEIDDLASERFLPWLYTQDSELEVWQDEKTWMKSNPTLGVVKRVEYLQEQVELARRSKSDRAFIMAKDFNIHQSNSQAWLVPEDYKYEAKFDIKEFKNAVVLGAVDLAETTDLTCAKILLMKPNDSTKYVYTQYFIPESKLENSPDFSSGAKYFEWAKDGYIKICEGNENDLSIVADWFYDLYKSYNIKLLKCGYDQRFAKDFLNRMDYYGFECEMVYQNKQTLSNPMKLLEADLKSQRINYNENPIDQWCFGNASVEVDNFGQCMAVKINNQATKRIDGAVTAIILYEMYRRYRSEFNQYVNR